MSRIATADILTATAAIGPGDALQVMTNRELPLIDRHGKTLRYSASAGTSASTANTIAAIMNRRPFNASTLTAGPPSRGVGELTEPYATAYRAIWDDDSAYVVYSYLTPIAWYTDAMGWIIPLTVYGATTSKHQRLARRAVRAVTPVPIVITSLDSLKIASHDTGGHYFSPGTMEYFQSKIHGGITPVDEYSGYLVSSETYGGNQPRSYRVRTYESVAKAYNGGVVRPAIWFGLAVNEDGEDEVHDTLAEAEAALKALTTPKS